jgi:hypothetical protein
MKHKVYMVSGLATPQWKILGAFLQTSVGYRYLLQALPVPGLFPKSQCPYLLFCHPIFQEWCHQAILPRNSVTGMPNQANTDFGGFLHCGDNSHGSCTRLTCYIVNIPLSLFSSWERERELKIEIFIELQYNIPFQWKQRGPSES